MTGPLSRLETRVAHGNGGFLSLFPQRDVKCSFLFDVVLFRARLTCKLLFLLLPFPESTSRNSLLLRECARFFYTVQPFLLSSGARLGHLGCLLLWRLGHGKATQGTGLEESQALHSSLPLSLILWGWQVCQVELHPFVLLDGADFQLFGEQPESKVESNSGSLPR